MSMILQQIAVGPMQNFSYLLGDRDTLTAAIIDPGWEADTLYRHASDQGLTIGKILLTHTHFDHIGALADLQSMTAATIFVHQAEAGALQVSGPVTPAPAPPPGLVAVATGALPVGCGTAVSVAMTVRVPVGVAVFAAPTRGVLTGQVGLPPPVGVLHGVGVYVGVGVFVGVKVAVGVKGFVAPGGAAIVIVPRPFVPAVVQFVSAWPSMHTSASVLSSQATVVCVDVPTGPSLLNVTVARFFAPAAP